MLTLFLSSLLSLRYIKSTGGLVEASRRLKTSGTAAHGGTLPAGRPSTAIFLGTACQSIPQCPTTPLETNGLKQQQLQTAWILSFLVFLFLFLQKIICIPPKHPTHLGDLSGSCLPIPAEYPCSEPFPPPLHCTAMAESFLFALSHQYLPRCRLRTNPSLPLLEGILS